MNEEHTQDFCKSNYGLRSKRYFDIESLQETANSRGLSCKQILKIISAIESKDICMKYKLELMKCLIPLNVIPEESFIRLTGLLTNFKFPIELKVEILKWMISVISFVEEMKYFRLLYEVYLQLLNQEILRPYVCHLLYLITSKEDITTGRYDFLFKLVKKCSYQPCLMLLLITYKNFSLFWDDELKESIEYHFESLGVYPDLIKAVHPSYNEHASSIYITTYEASVCATSLLSGVSTVLKDSSVAESFVGYSFQELFHEFMSLKKSTNISKILKSKFRRLFLTSDIPLKKKIEIYDFIMSSLYDEENFSSCEFLESILEVFRDMEESLCAVSGFTEMLLSSWDGVSNLDVYIALLEYEPICCFHKILYKLNIMRQHMIIASVPIKCKLFCCLSKIYENWVLLQYDRFLRIPCQRNCSMDVASDSLLFSEPDDEIELLGAYIDDTCIWLLSENLNFLEPCILNHILLHYERLSIINAKRENLILHLPVTPVFHAALFSFSSITLDNLCRLMLRCNAELTRMKLDEIKGSKQFAKLFRLYSHDILNNLSLERYEKKNTILSNTKAFLSLKEQFPNLKELLAIHRHPALMMKAAIFTKEMEDLNIPYTKIAFLEYLAEKGPPNLIKFITLNIVKS